MVGPSSETILITGANGYVAGGIVKVALEKAYNVRCTARSECSIAKIKDTFFPEYVSQLSFTIVKDITKPESYKDAFNGVTGVFHTASPFILKPKDTRRDLLDPAIKGSVSILEAAKLYGPSVKRVIDLASFASNLDMEKGYRPGYTYTEADWNPMTYNEAAESSNGAAAYCASKALSEKAMWDWMDNNETHFTLTSICPPWVFGPIVGRFELNKLGESMEAMWNLIGATSVPPVDFAGFIDIRDLANAMILAFETPAAAGQRFTTGTHFDWQTALDELRKEMPELKDRVPEGSPGAGLTQDVYKIDGSKAEKILGLKYTPINVTIRDVFKQLLAAESRA
jgi:NADPH-dependent methylglyoxal reductase